MSGKHPTIAAVKRAGEMWQDQSGRVHTPLEPFVLAATLLLIPVLILQADAEGAWLTVAYVVDESGWIRINPAVYFIDHLPVHVEPLDVLVVVGASIAVAVLATVYPSRTAAGLTPVEAIRHE